jgi:hypothetical protein
MKKLYLVLAILGAIASYFFFSQFFLEEGVDMGGFISAIFANGVVRGFTADLFVTSFIFWLYMFHQSSKGKGPNPALFILLTLTIGLSCAFPAYLYAREKSVE